jgi:hypothetical protein
LAVASIGHLVPPADFSCHVHSVFSRACNFEFRDSLLTLVAPGAGDGPTALVLRSKPPCDLRQLFSAGEVVRRRGGIALARRAALLFGHASVWRPRVRRPLLAHERIVVNLRVAAARLALCRQTRSSCIDSSQGAAIAAALEQACRLRDHELAVGAMHRLIGWGEGLTPAGDDFLVGHLAAWTGVAQDDDERRFLDRLCAFILASERRTTPISAHLLRLAVQGHFSAVIDNLRDALVCEGRSDRVSMAVDHALDQGATSGADMVSGLLAGLWARLPVAMEA